MKTKTAEELRTEFEQETGRLINVYWEGEVDNPAYTCWLENKLIKEYASQKPVAMSVEDKGEIQKLMEDWDEWRNKTFPNATPISQCIHLLKEVEELKQAIFHEHSKDEIGSEFADCFILLLNTASQFKLTFDDLVEFSKTKMEVNKKRKWGNPDKDGVVQHVEDKGEKEQSKGVIEQNPIYDNYVLQKCDGCGRTPAVIYATPTGRFCAACNPIINEDAPVTLGKNSFLDPYSPHAKWATAQDAVNVKDKGEKEQTKPSREELIKFCKFVLPTIDLFVKDAYDKLVDQYLNKRDNPVEGKQ